MRTAKEITFIIIIGVLGFFAVGASFVLLAQVINPPTPLTPEEAAMVEAGQKFNEKLMQQKQVAQVKKSFTTNSEKNQLVSKISNALKEAGGSLRSEGLVKDNPNAELYTILLKGHEYGIISIWATPFNSTTTSGTSYEYSIINIWGDKISKVEVLIPISLTERSTFILAAATGYLIEELVVPTTERQKYHTTTFPEWTANSMRSGNTQDSIVVGSKRISYSYVEVGDTALLALTIDYLHDGYDDYNNQLKLQAQLERQKSTVPMSEYCKALKEWNEQYQDVGWLTAETKKEYSRLCV